MKVLVVSHIYPSSAFRSRGTFVHNQVRFLRSHAEVEVLVPIPWAPPLPGSSRWSTYSRVGAAECLDGVEVRYPRILSLPRRFLFARAWRSYLAALERSVSRVPDLVHAHWAYPDGYAAVQYGRRVGRPVVISVHGIDVGEIAEAKPQWRQRVADALAGAARVIVSSQDIRRRVLDLGVAAERVHFIPQGVDCEVFRPQERRTPGAGGWRLLYVGRFDVRKGLGVLLEAMVPLRARLGDVALKLIGGTPVSGAATDFARQARSLGIAERVEFVDEQPEIEIARAMAAADLLVLPSFYDSFGVVLIEAMACGLPVVSTRCGGPNDIVVPEVGRLVEPGDPVGLANAIADTLEGYARYDPAAIRERARSLYDYRQLAQRISDVYREILTPGEPDSR